MSVVRSSINPVSQLAAHVEQSMTCIVGRQATLIACAKREVCHFLAWGSGLFWLPLAFVTCSREMLKPSSLAMECDRRVKSKELSPSNNTHESALCLHEKLHLVSLSSAGEGGLGYDFGQRLLH